MAINTIYLDGGVLKSANRTFSSQAPKNIRLENFFQKAVFKLLQNKLHNAEYSLRFHPYKYKYFIAKSKEIDSFLKGRYFDMMVKKVIGLDKYKMSYEIRKFKPGCYTLLHDAEKEKEGVDFIIDFSKLDTYFGGYTTYLTETEELLTLSPKTNTLSFVERKNKVMKYTLDAENKAIGRVATQAAVFLQGKNTPLFAKNKIPAITV